MSCVLSEILITVPLPYPYSKQWLDASGSLTIMVLFAGILLKNLTRKYYYIGLEAVSLANRANAPLCREPSAARST